MKVGIVVQRYGADINGGAELHARYIAERLSSHVDVRVFTTCARDYVTWRNEFQPGIGHVNGIPVERFPVLRERNEADFHRIVPGEWTWADIEREFGPPARIDAVASWNGPVWTYRWRDLANADMFYWVYLDPQGIVRRAHPGMEQRDRFFNFRPY